MSTINKLYIFDGLPESEVAYFLLMSQTQYHKSGEVIIRQGDVSNGCAYYLASGRARVIQDGQEVATLEPETFFGEIALITNEKRTATVELTEDAELQVFLKDDFLMIFERSSHANEMKAEIMQRILQRVRKPDGTRTSTFGPQV